MVYRHSPDVFLWDGLRCLACPRRNIGIARILYKAVYKALFVNKEASGLLPACF